MDLDGPVSWTAKADGARAPRKSQPASQSLSCKSCRRRKVRCNRQSPCDKCIQSGLDCIFPGARKPRRPADGPPYSELISRLRRLEGLIQQFDEEKHDKDNSSSSATSYPSNIHGGAIEIEESYGDSELSPKVSLCGSDARQNLENEFGGATGVEGQGSRYVPDKVWASLVNEIEELHDALEFSEPSNYSSPQSAYAVSEDTHGSFLFGHYSQNHSLHSFHPDPAGIKQLWNYFKENVVPVCPIFHKPSFERLVTTASNNLDSLDRNSEAAMFAMYLAAAATMTPTQYSTSGLADSRDALVKRFRFAIEQALSRANLLNTQSLLLLQSAALFLFVIRTDDDTKFVWSMTALLLRLAQSIGLHRESKNHGLSPWQAEMRRRLWWHIYMLDYHSAEYHGSEYAIVEGNYDTRLPQNINDEDISPEMEEPPPDRQGFTDMTFCLMRCEIAQSNRRIHSLGSEVEIATRELMAQQLNQRIEERYLKDCTLDSPFGWVTATVTRLMLAKLWLALHRPMLNDTESPDPHDLVIATVELIEFQWLVHSNPITQRWAWLMPLYMQWQAMAFILTQLCLRPVGPLTDRAWNAIKPPFEAIAKSAEQKKSAIWRPLSRLYARAESYRQKQLTEILPPSEPAQVQLSTPSGLSVGDLGSDNASQPEIFSQEELDMLAWMSNNDFAQLNAQDYGVPLSELDGLNFPLPVQLEDTTSYIPSFEN